MRRIRSFLFVLALAVGAPALIHAQAQAPQGQDRAPVTERAEGMDWGWLGLLGLAGLFGLQGRRRDTYQDVTRERPTGTHR